MEHHIELLARSPTKDFKFLLANVPEKYFKEKSTIQTGGKEDSQETTDFPKTRKAKQRQRKKRFTKVCKATLGYIKGLEDLLMFVLERKTGTYSSSKGEMYYHASISQVCEDMLEQPLSTEYMCSRRPCNMTDEDKCVMQYLIHQQVQAVDPQLCASLQLLSHEPLTAETWTRQQRSDCMSVYPGVPPPLFSVPVVTSLKQMSGGGIVCQQTSLPSSPPIIFPCCSNQAACPLVSPHLSIPDCPECNRREELPAPPALPCCSDAAVSPDVYSACSRLCDSSLDYCLPKSSEHTEVSSSYQSAMEDLLLEGCDSPTESFQEFDTNLWNDKVPMDIDDIEVAQLAF